jgi:hypothetical protein
MVARFLDSIRQAPWTWAGLLLVGMLMVVGAMREGMVHWVQEHAEAQRTAVVEKALTAAEDRFAGLQERVRGQAERLATDSVIVRGVQSWSERGVRSVDMAQHLLGVQTDDRTTIEVYSTVPRVLAWNGRRVPLGDVPQTEAFLQRPQTTVLHEGTVRHFLVVWWPVRVGGEVQGAVRVARAIQYRPPIQNRYIQGFGLVGDWKQATGESLRLRWTAPPSDLDVPHRILRGAHGEVLGYVAVTPPSDAQLVRRTKTFYDDLLAGGIVLLLAWMLGVAGGHLTRRGRSRARRS